MLETDPASFKRSPHGTYVRGRTWLVWSWGPGLGGFTLWNTPDATDAQNVVDLFNLPAPQEPADVLVDAHRVTGVEPVGFGHFTTGLRKLLPAAEIGVRRVAIVLPDGWVGAVVAGLQHVVAPRYPWQTFASMAAALQFLDRPHAVEAAQEVAAIVAQSMNQEPLVPRLQAYLAQQRMEATVHDAALELGVSVRSLQRALSEGGTTYREELVRAQRTQAQRLLTETDDKLESVALSLGFTSLQHFSTQFKRWTGMTPTQYRQAGRQQRP